MNVVVIGSGLAGTVAALAAHAAGAEVTLVGRRPGATALWSGVAEIYGPIYDFIDHQDPIGGPHLVAPGRSPLEDRLARFDRLMRRRSFHPYGRLALDLPEVVTLTERSTQLLGVELTLAEAVSYVANYHGTARLADAALPSIWRGRLQAEADYAVVGFEHFPAFSPDAVARALADQGLRAEPVSIGSASTPLAHSPSQAAARLEAMSDSELEELGRQMDRIGPLRTALLPPILGRTPEAHRRIIGRLAGDHAASPLAELASVHKSVHGFRFHQELASAIDGSHIEARAETVSHIDHASRRVQAVELSGGDRIPVDALVLATGRAVGGGVTRSRPLAEALLGLPLYLGGAPLDPGQRPPELATRRLFDDHPLFTVGIGITPELRPLDVEAEQAYDNVYASGLVIGGTNFTRDGTAFGVALVTGYVAGRRAAGAEV